MGGGVLIPKKARYRSTTGRVLGETIYVLPAGRSTCSCACPLALAFVVLVAEAVVGQAFATAIVLGVAAAFTALVAAPLATALPPDGVGHCVERLDWGRWIVAGDNKLGGDRDLLGRFVANYHAQAGAGSDCGWEGVVHQLPVLILAFERHARDVQGAFTDIADGDCSFGAAARLDAAEAQRAGHGQLARGCLTSDCDRVWAVGVTTRHGDRGGLGERWFLAQWGE